MRCNDARRGREREREHTCACGATTHAEGEREHATCACCDATTHAEEEREREHTCACGATTHAEDERERESTRHVHEIGSMCTASTHAMSGEDATLLPIEVCVESKGVGDRKGVPHPTVRVRARACFAPEVLLD